MSSRITARKPVPDTPRCVRSALSCLNKAEQEKLWHYFTQCRWLCNHLISLDPDAFREFDTRTRDIASLDKEGNPVSRCLAMPAKFIQSVYSSLKQDMAALAAKREKTGKKNGCLKFRSEKTGKKNGCLKFRSSYDSIDLTSMETHTGSAMAMMAIRMGSTGILST